MSSYTRTLYTQYRMTPRVNSRHVCEHVTELLWYSEARKHASTAVLLRPKILRSFRAKRRTITPTIIIDFHFIYHHPEMVRPSSLACRGRLVRMVSFFTLLLSSSWIDRRGDRCRPFFPPVLALHFLSRMGFSNPTARRFLVECCYLTLFSRFPQVNLCTTVENVPTWYLVRIIRVCTRGRSKSRN